MQNLGGGVANQGKIVIFLFEVVHFLDFFVRTPSGYDPDKGTAKCKITAYLSAELNIHILGPSSVSMLNMVLGVINRAAMNE